MVADSLSKMENGNFKNAKEKARINTTLEKSDTFPTQNIYYNINWK